MVGLKINDASKGIIVEAFVVPNICSDHNTKLVSESYSHLRRLYLADYVSQGTMPVDILIELDYYFSSMTGRIRKDDVGEPVAIETSLGWVVCSRYNENRMKDASTNLISTQVLKVESENEQTVISGNECIKLSKALTKFWDLDTLDITEREELVYEKFEKDIISYGIRYIVKLPFKPYTEILPDNYTLVKSRLLSLERRIDQTEGLQSKYSKVLCDFENNGIIERINSEGEFGRVHYLPHRAVLREKRKTTKLRIVFDVSAKMYDEPLLNDLLYSGPCMLPFLYGILLRFRISKVGLIADIKQAFLNLGIADEHRDFLRFLRFSEDGNQTITLYSGLIAVRFY